MIRISQTEQLQNAVLSGNMRALARAATLIEHQTAEGRELIAGLFPHTGRTLTIGITGPPGAGKSTLVDQLIRHLRSQHKSVGVIAVDPSSPFSGGAILGDRIRMGDHYRDSGVFIRSVATRGQLGGLARNALELCLLFDAAGLDVVLLETVGVGQDEIAVAQLADITVVVLVPGLGDDIQAIKAGILEIADIFAINKADLPGVGRLEQDLRAMQILSQSFDNETAIPVQRVIASSGIGTTELWSAIINLFAKKGRKGAQVNTWTVRLRELLRERIDSGLSNDLLWAHAERVASRKEDPHQAVEALRRTLL